MIRVTVPRLVADALMPGVCGRCNGRGHFKVAAPTVNYGHAYGDRCDDCHGSGSMPPVLRLMVVEGEPEQVCDCPPPWADCTHPPRPVCPPAIVRAIEAGERIGIDVGCECGGTDEGFLRSGVCYFCYGDGRVPVGSVRPVRVLPVVAHGEHHTVGRYIVFTGTRTFEVTNSALPVLSGEVDLSVYGSAESLVGRFAVEVEDARREP